MKLLIFRETRYLASFQQNATKNTPRRATFLTPLSTSKTTNGALELVKMC